jgi:hypothetical protein
MGYTHYWQHAETIPPETWCRILTDTRQLMAFFVDHDGIGLSECRIDKHAITFNGKPPQDFETFGLTVGPQSTMCKTALKPYDLLACAVLSIAKQHYPAIQISSDGLFEGLGMWPQSVKWASKVLDREVHLPWDVRLTMKGRAVRFLRKLGYG